MPAVASYINGFNVGTDVSFTISDQYGDVFPGQALGHISMFSSRSEDNVVKSTPISNGGRPIYQVLWNGHRGSMRFTRFDGKMQRMMISLMNAYHTSGVISQMTILQKVRNRDGSFDLFKFSGVQLGSPNFGSFSAVREVDMGLDFYASQLDAQGSLDTLLTGIQSATV